MAKNENSLHASSITTRGFSNPRSCRRPTHKSSHFSQPSTAFTLQANEPLPGPLAKRSQINVANSSASQLGKEPGFLMGSCCHIPAERVKVAPGFRGMSARMGHGGRLLPVAWVFWGVPVQCCLWAGKKPRGSPGWMSQERWWGGHHGPPGAQAGDDTGDRAHTSLSILSHPWPHCPSHRSKDVTVRKQTGTARNQDYLEPSWLTAVKIWTGN